MFKPGGVKPVAHNKELKMTMSKQVKLFIGFCCIPLTFIGVTHCTYYGWLWFITPLGVPPIDLLHAYGLYIFVKYCTYNTTEYKTKDSYSPIAKEPLETCIKTTLIPYMTWFMMWIVHLFM